ncbi:MAG: hypothetical protein HOQ45_08305, partial [Nocardioidaceae bacterium]|nr:hypothetical protein [Nocardioidaceae bacterium]
RAWDERRAAAWAQGSEAGLRSLYVAGSRAGAADVRLLRGYLARGYVVRGLRTQLLELLVLDRSSSRWRLRVTDRLAAAVAVHGSTRLPLPRDGPSTRDVVLVRAEGSWRVASVTPARR